MKKTIYSLIATILISVNCFSNTPTLENEIDVKEENKVENLTLSKKRRVKKMKVLAQLLVQTRIMVLPILQQQVIGLVAVGQPQVIADKN